MSEQVVLVLIAAVVLVLLVVIYQYRHEISITGKRGDTEFRVEARNASGEARRNEITPESKGALPPDGKAGHTPAPTVISAHGGVAAGGNVQNNKISIRAPKQ
jgi:hypothetical protein